jgi:selenocysteine lyase/cysteine desulfurase
MENMDVTEYRSLFPHIENGVVHLNHAGISPYSVNVANALRELIDRMCQDPITGEEWARHRFVECRSAIARLMGVSSDNVAITKNTAQAVSIAASGFKFEPGDEIIIAGCEYPSNSYPWLAQQDRGVVVKVVPPRKDGTVPPEDYAAAITPKTRVIAASWVQFLSGYRCDLAALATLAHENNAIFSADVIQGIGSLPLDLIADDVDVCATGGQKWLMGPLGMGALYINPRVLDRFSLINVGACSVNNIGAFAPLALDPKPNAQRYEEGTPNIPGAVGLLESIKILESAGIANIQILIRNITRYAIDALKSKGYNILSPDDDNQRSGIVIFNHPTIPTDELAAKFKAAKINVTARGGNIRISPHFYTVKEDIDKALAAIA